MVQRHQRYEDQDSYYSQVENTNDNVLISKKIMGFSTSQYKLKH